MCLLSSCHHLTSAGCQREFVCFIVRIITSWSEHVWGMEHFLKTHTSLPLLSHCSTKEPHLQDSRGKDHGWEKSSINTKLNESFLYGNDGKLYNHWYSLILSNPWHNSFSFFFTKWDPSSPPCQKWVVATISLGYRWQAHEVSKVHDILLSLCGHLASASLIVVAESAVLLQICLIKGLSNVDKASAHCNLKPWKCVWRVRGVSGMKVKKIK